jgi:hypothetical protein
MIPQWKKHFCRYGINMRKPYKKIRWMPDRAEIAGLAGIVAGAVWTIKDWIF